MTPEKRASRKQEDRTADRYNGSIVPGSGAGWKSKGDVRTHEFMIENKLKMNPNAKSFTVKAVDLRDLTKRARLEGRTPLLQFDLAGHSYVILVEGDFLEKIGAHE